MGLISVDQISNGDALDATVVDGNFDTIVNEFNGDIDEDNISPSAQIANSQLADIAVTKVLDHADNIATYRTTTFPGDTATPSLPATLAAEWERMRYRVGANRGYLTGVKYMNSSSVATDAAWFEPPIVGRNLIRNPGFELHTAGTPNAPDGWTLVSTPATVAIENPAYTGAGLEKRSLNIVTNGANEGISQTVSGLKTDTKYLVGIAYTLTDNGTVAGVLRLSTSGGLASGNYQNLQLDASTEAASTISVLQGIVKPTATPDPIVVSITATTAGADFNLIDVWFYELADSRPMDIPAIPMQTARDITAATYPSAGWTGSGTTWRTETLTSLSLTQYVPFHGYRLVYEVSVPYSTVDSSAAREASRVYLAIQQNIDGGGATTVAGPVIMEIRSDAADMRDSGSFYLRHVVDNPTPGSSYAFTTLLGVYDDTNFEQISLPPLVGSVQMAADARLIVERV